MSNDKLVDLENRIVQRLAWLREGSLIDVQAFTADIEAMLAQSRAAEAAQIAHNDAIEAVYERENNPSCGSAQAQAQSGEWVMVPREPTKAMIEASCKIKLGRLEALRDGHGASSGVASAVREEWDAMLAAAPQQAAEPVASIGSYWGLRYEGSESIAKLAEKHGITIGTKLYTHPQPAQDARLPSDEDFRLHLGELTSAELRVAQAAFRYAMAKESGNG